MFFDRPAKIRIGDGTSLHQIHVATEQRLKVLLQQKVDVVKRASAMRMKLDEKIEIASTRIERAIRRRPEEPQGLDAMPFAQPANLFKMSRDDR